MLVIEIIYIVFYYYKGLKVNTGKSKVMVGSSGGKMIINSGKWTCGVCEKGGRQTLFSAQYVKSWIRRRCSGMHGELLRVTDGFRCR